MAKPVCVKKESNIVKEILLALSAEYKVDGLFYRRNIGSMKTENGYVRFGLPGQADIGGILLGTAIEIEAKTLTGRQRAEQKLWQSAVERAGGIYILCRSADDCLKQIRDKLIHQSINPLP